MSRSDASWKHQRFSASQQLATAFVLRNLANPAGVPASQWVPADWQDFGWFTEIVCTAMKTLEVREGEYDTVFVLERRIIFRLEEEDVARITMYGEQVAATTEYPRPTIAWAVRRVEYRLRWHSSGEMNPAWIDRSVDVVDLITLPPEIAPIG